MTKNPTRRQLLAISPDMLLEIEAAREEQVRRTREPVSRAAMIRALLRRGLDVTAHMTLKRQGNQTPAAVHDMAD